ncbi:MAG: cytochrome c3 family protein [Planctomycetota bacterium]
MKRRLTLLSALALCAGLLLCPPARGQGSSSVVNTKHNLSATGPGPVKVAGESGVCKFCHTPHASNPVAPLWNRQDPGTYYQTYESTTLEAEVGQPTGTSRLCLSCHDGTIALAQTYNSRNAPGGTVYITPEDTGYLGTDLTDDHPVSFEYDSALALRQGELAEPTALPPELPLEHGDTVQCTTCHDAHDDTYGDFLRMSNAASRLCVTCHRVDGWTVSAHSNSGASLASATRETWDNIEADTVREAGCENCHRPHSAGGRQRLLRHEAEESNCFACHDGSVARVDLTTDFLKPSHHPVQRTTGVHDPTEDPTTMREHVECADCHDPHRSPTGGSSNPPFLRPSMRGASGVTDSGRVVAEATYEYEVCYKCHSRRNVVESPVVDRFADANSIADEFSPTNASYHPVQTQGKNARVPSLLNPLNPSSMIYCTDCHGVEESGREGTHGSIHRPMLKRNYTTIDGRMESPQAYALCYECHNRSSIMADESFPLHRLHVVEERTACSVCHDPHGVSARHAAAGSSTHLINFDRDVVRSSQAAGRGPAFQDGGTFNGSCTLLCHGKDHVDESYPR